MLRPQLKTTAIQESHTTADNSQTFQIKPTVAHRKPTVTKIVKIEYSPRQSTKLRPATSVITSTHTFLTDKFNPPQDFSATKTLTGKLGMEVNDAVEGVRINDDETVDATSNAILGIDCSKFDELNESMSISIRETLPIENVVLPETSSAVTRIEEIQMDSQIMKSASIFGDTKTKRTVLSIPMAAKLPSMKKPSVKTVVVDEPLPTRTKSYDPIKARQFMQEQRKKRLSQGKCNGVTTVGNRIQQEEIKKRLAALNANSLKIVANNLKHMKKDSGRQQMSDTSSTTNVVKRFSQPARLLGTASKSAIDLTCKRKLAPTSKWTLFLLVKSSSFAKYFFVPMCL